MEHDANLQITFPKSSEDHRLQLVEINGSIFAILHSPLESLGPIHLLCEDWSLVLLAPIKSQANILISGINVICLNEISSEEGFVNIHASNRLVKSAHLIKPSEKVCTMGEKGEFQFDDDDSGTFLNYYRLFNNIVSSLRNGTISFSEVQQEFILCLCILADKIEGKSKNLNLHKVLNFWKILNLKT